LILVFLVGILIGVWHITVTAKSIQDIPKLHLKDIALETGDIVLFRHKKYNFNFPRFDFVMSHVGIIWTSCEGPMLVDMNPTFDGPWDPESNFYCRGPYVNVLPMKDVVKEYPGVTCVRKVKKSLTLDQEILFTDMVFNWTMHLQYSQHVKNRQFITWICLAFSNLLPNLSLYLSQFSSLSFTRTESFCSEMVALFAKHVGILPRDFPSCILGPIAFQNGFFPLIDEHWYPELHLMS